MHGHLNVKLFCYRCQRLLHTSLAAETYLADGQLQKIAVNREEFLKLQGITGTTLVSK